MSWPFYGYPAYHFQRGEESDTPFVISRMRWIPEELKLEVSKKYESFGPVHGGEKRKAANIWLDTEARKYRNATSKKDDVLERVNAECNAPESTAKEFKPNIDTSAPVKPKGFLDGLLDDIDNKYRNSKN